MCDGNVTLDGKEGVRRQHVKRVAWDVSACVRFQTSLRVTVTSLRVTVACHCHTSLRVTVVEQTSLRVTAALFLHCSCHHCHDCLLSLISRVGQNRADTPYTTLYLVISLPTIPCMVLTNPTH